MRARFIAVALAALLASAPVLGQVNQSFVAPNGGHLPMPGATGTPTLTNCGAGTPSINQASTDSIGDVNVGNASGTATGCTVNFVQPFRSPPICLVIVETGARAQTTLSYTVNTFTVTGLNGADAFHYFCFAVPGGQ